jgi:uncharacterized protein (DUF1786 family)
MGRSSISTAKLVQPAANARMAHRLVEIRRRGVRMVVMIEMMGGWP